MPGFEPGSSANSIKSGGGNNDQAIQHPLVKNKT